MIDPCYDGPQLLSQKPFRETPALALVAEREACKSTVKYGYLIHARVRREKGRDHLMLWMLGVLVGGTDR